MPAESQIKFPHKNEGLDLYRLIDSYNFWLHSPPPLWGDDIWPQLRPRNIMEHHLICGPLMLPT